MKSLIFIIVVATLLAGAWACAKSPSKPIENPVEIGEPRENAEVTDSDSVVLFRYESREVVDGKMRFEACEWQKNNGRIMFYYSKLGTREGTHIYNVDGRAALDSITAALRGKRWSLETFAEFDKWKDVQNCWMFHATLQSGAEICIACEHESPRGDIDVRLNELTRRLVDRQIEINKTSGIESEYSISTLKPDGSLSQRIDYLSDGTVKGGYDPDEPLNSF